MKNLWNGRRACTLRSLAFSIPLAFALTSAAADYATYIGDTDTHRVAAIAVDASGNTYATGSRTVGEPPKATDVFVTKVDSPGNVTLLATFSGSGTDRAQGIAVDPAGNIYIAGNTTSPDFPLRHPLQSTIYTNVNPPFLGTGFLTKLSPDGAVLYSTFLGGTTGPSMINAVATDAQGDAYVTGETFAADYPSTTGLPNSLGSPGAFSAVSAAFFAKISPAGDRILFAGGIGATTHTCGCCSSCFLRAISTAGVAIAVDPSGNAYLAGNTNGAGLPTTAGSLHEKGVGAFVAKVNSSGTGMVYVSYVGAGYLSEFGQTLTQDAVFGIAADAAGNAYLSGSTNDPSFPATPGAFQTKLSNPATPVYVSPTDAFVAKLNPTGTAILWATFLGGSGADQATTIAINSSGVWVSGTTQSTDFPVTGQQFPGNEFLVGFNATGSSLTYGSLFPYDMVAAALAIDANGVLHTAGRTDLVSTITPSLSSAGRLYGVASAAGFELSSNIAPGELISIYGLHLGPPTPLSASFDAAGFLPTSLGGRQVMINGIPAPLLYVSDTQINAVVPIELAAAVSSAAIVTISGVPAAATRVMVEEVIPAVFRDARRVAVALNQDGTVNSLANPAKAGSIVTIWATGVGWTDQLGDGQLQTSAHTGCACTIHNFEQNTDIAPSYAGAAPGTVNGVKQINFRVMNPGDYYSLSGSNDEFTIAVVR